MARSTSGDKRLLGQKYGPGEQRPINKTSNRKARELRELLKKPMPGVREDGHGSK